MIAIAFALADDPADRSGWDILAETLLRIQPLGDGIGSELTV